MASKGSPNRPAKAAGSESCCNPNQREAIKMRWGLTIIALALVLALPSVAVAQDGSYPTHPVRLIVPSGVGGNPDVLGRLLADQFSKDFGKAFLVENVPGAGGAVASIMEAKEAPDGYILMFGDSGAMAINPAINPDIGYDPMKDFTPITALASVPTILVANPSVPAVTLADFIALAKKEPGKMSYGSAGVGSIHHLTMAIFAERTGIDLLHVPYRGGSAMVNGILTGEIQVGWSGIPNVMALIAGGQMRGYCISVLQRSPSTPAIPTCDELGLKGFDVATVMGLYGPAGMSSKLVATLQAETAKVMREPAIAARMEQLGIVMEEDGTANYVQFRKDDFALYAGIVHKLNLQTK
jgi:tripartite-type tricarboxylate transporter receptor subunit TctC